MDRNKRIHAFYSGSVQGVGFRLTSERIAGSLALTGWVRNLSDGRVEVMCEGREADLNEFLRKIKEIFREYIVDADIEWRDPSGEFAGFDIR